MGGRGSGSGHSGGAGGVSQARTDINVLTNELEAQITEKEQQIADLNRKNDELMGQTQDLVKARNYGQISANIKKSNQIAKQVAELEKELAALYRRDKYLQDL